MNTQTPFRIQIFVVDGDPDGLRLIDRSNWNGKAVIFPRALFTQVRSRSEFSQAGVYLLLGPRTDGEGETLYIGEGDPVRPRLEAHFANKDFWTWAVFFIAGPGDLNKAHVQYLEAQLLNRATLAKRMLLDNANRPADPTLSEADRAIMDVFLSNILGIVPVLGIRAFEVSTPKQLDDELTLLTCQGRGVIATGYDTSQGFVVRSGSLAVTEETVSLKDHFPYISELRIDLLKNEVLVPAGDTLRFSQDYTFNSPSRASNVVLGRSSNGRIDWKDSTGRTLKELQEALALQ